MIKRSFTWLCLVVTVTWLLSLSRGAAAGTLTPTAQSIDLLGQISGATYAVAVAGDYAYAGIGPRLAILDVADPSHPVLVGQTAPLPRRCTRRGGDGDHRLRRRRDRWAAGDQRGEPGGAH